MIKNLVITLQLFIIVSGVLYGWRWMQFYQHRTEQIFFANHLRIMADDIRLLNGLKVRIDSGKSDQAASHISKTISQIVDEMEEHISLRVDPDMQDTFATAREAGADLDKIGIHRVSAAMDRKAQSEDQLAP